MTALALKRFDINESAAGQEESLHVTGRQAGLMAFLMSLAKIDPITEIKCNDERIQVVQSSFFGRQTIDIPIGAVTGIVGGHKKPRGFLVAIPIVLILGGSMTGSAESAIPILVALVISVILFIFYIVKKEMALYVQNGGDALWGLSFNRNVIEGVAIDNEKVDRAIKLINRKVLNRSN
jgi:hypothetical protein